jgi:hypothetical protein
MDQRRRRLSAAPEQGADGLDDGRIAACVLRRGTACLPERGDCLVPVPCPAVGACRLDVEVGPALGGEGGRRLPLSCEADGAGNVAGLDRKGEFVDTDASGAEDPSAVSA